MTGREVAVRWKSHKSAAKNGSRFRFHSAIRKYGEDAWNVEVMHEALEEDEARRLEEQTISRWNSTDSNLGYNAKPGGCGGWIVPDHKVEQWKKKQSALNKGFSNNNSSKFTDEDILAKIYEFYIENKTGFSIRKAIQECNRNFGTPLHLKINFRFVSYGGGEAGLRAALANKLNIDESLLEYRPSDKHKSMLCKAITGFRWYSNEKTGEVLQVRLGFGEYEQDSNWIRGRKKWH